MIEGEVNPFDEAVVPIRIISTEGKTFEIEAVIDTGFTGFLTLPLEDIQQLGLLFQQEEQFVVGRGITENFAIYTANIKWDEKLRVVPVLATDSGTLVGMKMLRGARLAVLVVDGGRVEIEVIE